MPGRPPRLLAGVLAQDRIAAPAPVGQTTRLYYLTDLQGSTTCVISDQAAILERYTYTHTGRPEAHEPDWDPLTIANFTHFRAEYLHHGQRFHEFCKVRYTTYAIAGLYESPGGRWFDPEHAMPLGPDFGAYASERFSNDGTGTWGGALVGGIASTASSAWSYAAPAADWVDLSLGAGLEFVLNGGRHDTSNARWSTFAIEMNWAVAQRVMHVGALAFDNFVVELGRLALDAGHDYFYTAMFWRRYALSLGTDTSGGIQLWSGHLSSLGKAGDTGALEFGLNWDYAKFLSWTTVNAGLLGFPDMGYASCQLYSGTISLDEWGDRISMAAIGQLVTVGALRAAAPKSVTGQLNNAYHYTSSRWAGSIQRTGLRPGSYATPSGNLTGLQAQIELSLNPTRAAPNMRIRINLDAMRKAGYEIPTPARVSNVVTDPVTGRVYTMPGGGYEMQFPYKIPSKYLEVPGQ